MHAGLLGERFYRHEGQWWDLVTTERVSVVAGNGPAFSPQTAARFSGQTIARGVDPALGAYEVHARWSPGRHRPSRQQTDARRIATTLELAGRLERTVHRAVRWPVARWTDGRRLICDLAPALGRLGFLVCRAAGTPPMVAHLLDTRHLALVVVNDEDRKACAVRLRRLAEQSVRAHLVIELCRAPPAKGATSARRRQMVTSGDRSAVRHVGRLVTAGEWPRAEVWLAAFLVEAPWRSRVWRFQVMQLLARLRTHQGRLEEADAARNESLAHRVTSRLNDVCGQEHNMYLLQAIPDVLQVVQDAEDELAALSGACRWARAQGATLVAFMAADGHTTVTVEGRRGEGVRDEEKELCARVEGRAQLQCPDGVSIAAAVRYAGHRVGAVLIRTDIARAQTLGEAAVALAALCAPALRARLDALLATSHARGLLPEILGMSPAMTAVRDAIGRAASSPFPVLIEGESGTGKELVARALHRLSPRRDRRLAALNCAALADDLVDAELFGHCRGAFTGAVGPRAGLFEEAHGGTLFLDEVGELSMRAQAKLLRVIQEREVRRLGENTTRSVDTRIVAATNRPLSVMVSRGEFREDLLFRLAVVRMRLPPLRDRTEDIAGLAQAFWSRMTREAGKRALIGADALARLVSHEWPGNVRELQNVMAGLVVLAPARGRVGSRHVDQVFAESGLTTRTVPVSLERARASCERRTVAAALARHAGRRSAAARELGLTRQGLTKAIRRLQLGRTCTREGVA